MRNFYLYLCNNKIEETFRIDGRIRYCNVGIYIFLLISSQLSNIRRVRREYSLYFYEAEEMATDKRNSRRESCNRLYKCTSTLYDFSCVYVHLQIYLVYHTRIHIGVSKCIMCTWCFRMCFRSNIYFAI